MMKFILANDTYYSLISKLLTSDIIKANDRVLLLGCNDKKTCARIAARVSEGHVVVADDSNDLSRLDKKITLSSLKNLSYVFMNPETIFFHEQYDVVIYFYHAQPSLTNSDVMTRIKKALTNEGKFILFIPLPNKLDMLAKLTTLKPKWLKKFKKIDLTDHLLTSAEYLNLLDHAGFKVTHNEKTHVPILFQSADNMDVFIPRCLPQVKKLPKPIRKEFIQELTVGYLINSSVEQEIQLQIPILYAVNVKKP